MHQLLQDMLQEEAEEIAEQYRKLWAVFSRCVV